MAMSELVVVVALASVASVVFRLFALCAYVVRVTGSTRGLRDVAHVVRACAGLRRIGERSFASRRSDDRDG
jgi:hypothetical protein